MTKTELEKVIDIIHKYLCVGISNTEINHIFKQTEKAGLITGTCETCNHKTKSRKIEPCFTCFDYANWQGGEK